MPKIDSRTQKALAATDWETVVPKLRYYAELRIRTMIWLGQLGGPLPEGRQADDIVQIAIRKVLEGHRAWPDNEVSFIAFLMGVISSELSNLSRRTENLRTLRAMSALPSSREIGHGGEVNIIMMPDNTLSIESTSSLFQKNFVRERSYILEKLADDPIACAVAEAIIDDDLYEPRKIAGALGLNVTAIYNAKKRIRSRLMTLLYQENTEEETK